MSVSTKRLTSEHGFETAGFVVSNGLLRVASLETTNISLGGENPSIVIVDGVVAISSKPGPSGTMNNIALGNTTPAGGSFTNLSAVTAVNFSTTGAVSIDSGLTGSMDNVAIGLTNPADAEFINLVAADITGTNISSTDAMLVSLTSTTADITTITATTGTISTLTSTNQTVTNLTINTSLTSPDITVDDIVINNQPTLPSHGTRKDYVDTVATALAIALGA
jgi:hypothetical protein